MAWPRGAVTRQAERGRGRDAGSCHPGPAVAGPARVHRRAAAVAVVLLSGALKSVTALLVGFAGLAIGCAAAWWFLAHRGIVRWLACAVLVAAPVAVIVVYAVAGLLWEIALSVVLAVAAVAAGRAALSTGRSPARPREDAAAPQRQPFVIMNPRSGGGRSGSSGSRTRPPRSAPRWPCSRVPEWWT